MMNDENDSDNPDTAAVWRPAERRPAGDLGGWLGALPMKKTKEDESGSAHQTQPI